MTDDRYRPIGDYGFISDCHATALIGLDGSIDWACLRRFDTGSAFGQILDARRGGCFSIRPTHRVVETSRRYLPATLVLETTMATTEGTIRCTDGFVMRPGGAQEPDAELLRIVECTDGKVEVDILIEPRFDYGRTRPWLRRHDDGRITAIGGDDAVVIHTEFDLDIDQQQARLLGRGRLSAGESLATTVLSQSAHRVDTSATDVGRAAKQLDTTIDWWQQWSADTDVDGPHAALLERSALVLKGLCCAPTGAVVAAATTSLPEVVGGSANWDYRYCWIRDASLALDALSAVGHPEVAQGFRDFVLRSSAGHGDELQIMYGPYGERELPERELDLHGWRGSSPVRVGNGAADQTQLDVYGHLLDAAHLWQGQAGDIDKDEWLFLASVVEQAASRRHDPDAGMWEMRGPPRHFVESKVMVWVALDRGVRLVENHGFDGVDVDRWQSLRDEVRHDIETRGVVDGHFVQHYDSTDLDASLLKLALVGFVDADEERMRATTDRIISDLATEPDGFLRRYPTGNNSAVDGEEGVFLLCTLWLVQVLALQDRVDEATALFEKVVAVGNDLDLFSEEFDPKHRELLGNYPQAFTHLGLISADKCLREATNRQSET